MAMISMNLRQRILKFFDGGDTTREQVVRRFGVSLGMGNKLIQQRRFSSLPSWNVGSCLKGYRRPMQ